MRSPSFERGTVVILSTMRMEDCRSAFVSSSSTRSRNSVASAWFVSSDTGIFYGELVILGEWVEFRDVVGTSGAFWFPPETNQ